MYLVCKSAYKCTYVYKVYSIYVYTRQSRQNTEAGKVQKLVRHGSRYIITNVESLICYFIDINLRMLIYIFKAACEVK